MIRKLLADVNPANVLVAALGLILIAALVALIVGGG